MSRTDDRYDEAQDDTYDHRKKCDDKGGLETVHQPHIAVVFYKIQV